MEVIIKPHPRFDYYGLYLLWAQEEPNLRVIMKREKLGTRGAQYANVQLSDRNTLRELIEVSDVVVSGPILNSAILLAARYKKPIVFPTAGISKDDFIERNYSRYFLCARDAERLQKCIDEVTSTNAPYPTKYDENLNCLSGVRFHDFAAS